MKNRYKFLIGFAIVLTIVIAGYFLLIWLSDFRKNNDYVDIPAASADGKSFHVNRIYDSDSFLNSMPPQKMSIGFYEYESCSKPGRLMAEINLKSDRSRLVCSSEVRDHNLYLIAGKLNDSYADSAEFLYYPKNGRPIARKLFLKNKEQLNPANIIICDEKTGFFHYDPMDGKTTKLCDFPDVKKDGADYLRQPGTLNNKFKWIRRTSEEPVISAMDKPGSFYVEIFMITDKNLTFSLYYCFDPDTKTLMNPTHFKGWSSQFISDIEYAAYDCRYALVKGSRLYVADLKEKKIVRKLEGYHPKDGTDFSPDTRYEARIDEYGREIRITDHVTDKTTLLYTENRFGARIEKILWFPAENKIIAAISLQEMINQKSMDFTEIIAIDPFTAAKNVISTPSPMYVNRNNQVFKVLCLLSEKAYEIRKKLRI